MARRVFPRFPARRWEKLNDLAARFLECQETISLGRPGAVKYSGGPIDPIFSDANFTNSLFLLAFEGKTPSETGQRIAQEILKSPSSVKLPS